MFIIDLQVGDRMKQNEGTNVRNRAIFLSSILVLAAGIGLFFHQGHGHDIRAGLKYIESQEALKPEEIAGVLAQKKQAEWQSGIEQGTIDIFAFFDDFALLGDSRVVGFEHYQYLPDSRVMAGIGYTIKRTDGWLTQLETMQPKNIYIAYGLNDIQSNLMHEKNSSYKDLYKKQMDKIQQVCPNSTIYVNSIIPVSENAGSNEPTLEEVNAYNQQIQEACKEYGWHYIDNSNLSSLLPDMYEQDGIHFISDFYPYWAQNMINSTEF